MLNYGSIVQLIKIFYFRSTDIPAWCHHYDSVSWLFPGSKVKQFSLILIMKLCPNTNIKMSLFFSWHVSNFHWANIRCIWILNINLLSIYLLWSSIRSVCWSSYMGQLIILVATMFICGVISGKWFKLITVRKKSIWGVLSVSLKTVILFIIYLF